MTNRILLVIFLLSTTFTLRAGEGMWLPQLLKALNEGEMQTMGMKLTAEQVYSVNQGSLKDAIVHFGGFCTSEVISDQGLLLTNHHCGYGQIQSHTTLEKNYLKNGFWAKNLNEELANPGLFARFIVRIDDVTKAMLAGVTDKMNNKERQSQIDKNMAALKKNTKLGAFEELMIRPFYHGNQYFSFTTVTYNDVRLVGAPPESIGKFGADTDNWEWPRHTGDFSLFRIYAGPNNEPAEYSENNKPYAPKHFLPISLDGVQEGDFTLIFGFPGRTNQYLPGVAVEQLVETVNPARIAIRDAALKILDAEMRKDEKTKIQYASKFARVANYWKKWIGENQGLIATNALAKKAKLEKEFQQAVDANPTLKAKYGDILPQFAKKYKTLEPYVLSANYYNEIMGRNIEAMRIVSYMRRLVDAHAKNGKEGYDQYKERISGPMESFYKNYSPKIDKQVFARLTEMYSKADGAKEISASMQNYLMGNGIRDYGQLADQVFAKSMVLDKNMVLQAINQSPEDAIKKIKNDPLFRFATEISGAYQEKIAGRYGEINGEIAELQRRYMAGLIEVFPDRRFWPDANSTMRVTYGKVQGYQPRDGITYNPLTTLDGVIAKYQPGDYEFDVPQKLIDLNAARDYGNYATADGKMPVCFLGSNHTTGGNSGSPAIDANGNLVGLNFDRVWEGTMSDINYDPSICRNIMVDARYILFIIDKYAGAGHLVKEMKLVHPRGNDAAKQKQKNQLKQPKSSQQPKIKGNSKRQKAISKDGLPTKEQKVVPYRGGGR